MPKACFAVLAFLCLLASACSPAATRRVEPVETASPVPLTAVSPAAPTLTLSPALTATPQPTLTPAPPTRRVEPVETITPLPRVECPQEKSDLIPDFPYCTPDGSCEDASYVEPILEFLNKGGAQKAILKAFDKGRNIVPNEYILSAELTGDKSPEFVYDDSNKGLVVLGCGNGQYKILLETDNPQDGVIDTQDLNADGISDLTVTDGYGLRIYGWDGGSFKPFPLHFQDGKENDIIYVDGTWTYAFVKNDQTYQINLQSGTPSPSEFRVNGINYIPYRLYKLTISWDRENFSVSYPEYTSAEYRFQAIQDADIFVLEQKYETAIDLYQQAIFSNKLGWWSLERRNYLFNLEWKKLGVELSPSMAKPPENNTDYRQLAAYAYYRMVILHTKLGEMDAAQTQYATLQEKFPAGSPGHPYVEMANAFWDAYQTEQNMTNACGAAIQYAAEHPEILTVLGSDYHGMQSHTYVPADVCPFR